MWFTIILILCLFIGSVMVVISLVQYNMKCPTKQVIYRYIPRTFNEEQREPVSVSEIFKTMFTQPSPWISSSMDYDREKQERVNKYYASQI